MQYCSFSQKNQDQAIDYVANKLNTVYLNSDTEFKLVPFMKASYNDLVGRTRKDGTKLMTPEKAFTFVKQIPELLAIAGGTRKFRGKLAKEATAIFEMAEELASENSAAKLLAILELDEETKKKQAEENRKRGAAEQQRKQQEEEEKKRKRLEENQNLEEIEVEESTAALVSTTTNQEETYIEIDGKKFYGKGKTNPIVQANSAFRRAMLAQSAGKKLAVPQSGMNMFVPIADSPYELRIVHASKVPDADRIKEDGKNFYSSVVMLYIDKATGKPIRINSVGEVVSEGGYLAHSWFRSPNKIKEHNEALAKVHLQILDNIDANPDLEYTLQITGGYLGYAVKKEELPFLPSLKTVITSPNQINDVVFENSVAYIDVEGYGYLIEMDAQAFNYINSNLQQATFRMLLDTTLGLSGAEKFNLLYDWLLNRHSKLFFLKDGKMFSERHNKPVEEHTPEELESLLGRKFLARVITADVVRVPMIDENGNVSVGTVTREEFYYDNYRAIVFTNAEGQPIAPNSTVSYERDFSVVKQVTSDALEQQKEKQPKVTSKEEAQQKLEEFKSKMANKKLLNKIDTLSSAATQEEIAAAEEWWKNHPLSKFIPLNRMFGIVNSGAVATWGNDGITLYAGSNYTDLYHEAWHGFSQLVLTVEEKEKLYNQASKILGIKSYRQIEEELAEDFRHYMLSGKSKVFGRSTTVNNIYKKIYEILKALFGNVGFIKEGMETAQAYDAVKEVYDNLASPKLMESLSPSWSNSMFVTLDKGIEDPTTGITMSSANSRYVSEAMDSTIVELIRNQQGDINALFSQISSLQDLYDYIRQVMELQTGVLEAELQEENITDLKRAELEESIEILKTAIDLFGDVKAAKSGTLNTIGYHLNNSDLMSSFRDIVESEDEQFELADSSDLQEFLERFDKSGNEQSIQELMDKRIKLMLATVPERDQQGNVVKDRFGFDKLLPFSKVFNDVQTVLANIQSKDDLYDRLLEAKNENDKIKAAGRRYNNIYEHLLLQIGSISSNDKYKQLLSGLLWRAFNLAYVPNKQIYASEKGALLNVVVKNPEGDTSKLRKKILAEFQARNPKGIMIKDVLAGYSVDSIRNQPALAYAFLYDLGILTGVSYTSELEDFLRNSEVTQSIVFLFTGLQSFLAPFQKKPMMEPIRVLQRPNGKFTGASGTINMILNEVLSLMPGMSISRKIAADGKNVYDLTLNSTQTQIIKSLNKAQTLQQLEEDLGISHLSPENNPLTKYSSWFNTMFDENGVRRKGTNILIQHFLGVFTDNVAEKNTNLTPTGKFIADMNTLFLSGMVEQFRASDKSTSNMINLNTTLRSTNSRKNSQAGKKGLFIAPLASGLQVVRQFFIDKLNADIEVARLFRSEDTNVQKAKGSSELAMFDAILESNPKLKAQIEALIDSNTSLEEFLSNIENSNAFDAAITEYFDAKAEQLLEQIDTSLAQRLLNPQALGVGANVTEEGIVSDSDLKTATRNFLINEWLINSELAALFVGDLGQFKDANDFTKRYAVTSTGNLFDTSESQQSFIQDQGNVYAEEALGLDRKDTKQYDGTANTVILRDLDESSSADGSLLSPRFQEGLRAYGKAYNISDEDVQAYIDSYKRDYNEADAQAHITLDSYRQLAIASQEWDWNIHEPLYRSIIKAATDENAEISYKEIAAAEKFFPVRKYQYYGPLLNAQVNGKKVHATALHKYSLKPLIPTPKSMPKKASDVLHDAMVKAKVDYVVFESGSKVNNVNDKVDVYNFETSETDGHVTRTLKPEEEIQQSLQKNVNVIHLNYLKDVTKVKDKYKGKAPASSQMRNLLPIGIYSEGQVLPGKEEAAKNYEQFIDSLGDYIDAETEKLAKIFSNKTPENLMEVARRIKRDLEKKEASDEEIEAVDTIIDNGGYIDALPNADRIETIITNILNKRLVKTKLVGEALVQVSSAFMEELDGPKVGYSNDLRFYEYADGKVTAAQAKIALQGDFVKLLALKYKGKPIGNLKRLNEAIKDEAWLNKGDHRRMITITGVRIPVQGHNSMEVLEIVEFLDPANGTAIVVPSELPVKSGGDFDVDKLTLFYPRIFAGVKKKKGTEALVDDMMSAIFGDEGKVNDYYIKLDNAGQAGSQNDMILAMTNIILDPTNYLNLISPNSTDAVKDDSPAYNFFAKEIAEEKKKGTALDYVFNLRKLQENSVGKRSLGIVAANNVIMALLTRVQKGLPKVVDALKTDGKGATKPIGNIETLLLPFNKSSLNDSKDVDGIHTKTKLTEQLINGFVDIAKGAWIFNIGADYYSTPVLLSLIAMGVNYDYAVAMINTPLMKNYFELKAKKKDPLYMLANPEEGMMSPMLKTLVDAGKISYPSWKEADRWMRSTIAKSDAPTMEDMLNEPEEFSDIAYAMFLQALPIVNGVGDLMRNVKVDTVTTSTIQEAHLVNSAINNMSGAFKEMAEDIFGTSVQGIYMKIKKFQSEGLKDWFALRGLDLSNFSESYTKIAGIDLKFASEATKMRLFRKISNHLTSYLHQNKDNTSFAELRNGTSKLLNKPFMKVELTGKIDRPVVYLNGTYLINVQLLEELFYKQRLPKHKSFEKQNGVTFKYQGNFIMHEIFKAGHMAVSGITEEAAADLALRSSMASEVLFIKQSKYNILTMFEEVKELAAQKADSDLIEKMRGFVEGASIRLGIRYTLVDPSEYKEDIRKLSGNTIVEAETEAEERMNTFFSLLSERIALQDNFENKEGSLMPYVLDKDLAKSLSQPIAEFASSTEENKQKELNTFFGAFSNTISDIHASYMQKIREKRPGDNTNKTIFMRDHHAVITKQEKQHDGSYKLQVAAANLAEENSFVFDVIVSPEGKVQSVSLNQRGILSLMEIEVGDAIEGVTFGVQPSPETTNLTEEEILEEMKKCNLK